MPLQTHLPTGRFWDCALSVLNARKRIGYFPNIFNPKTFNDHILAQKWKFEGDLELASRITEKGQVKDWLAELGFHNLIIPTIGLFESVDEIEKFNFEGDVIAKPTHGSGDAIIRTADRGKAFIQDDLETFRGWLSEDYYLRSREPNYKKIRRRIIVEPLLLDETGTPPKDYKIFCTNGTPFAIQVDHGRYAEHTRQLYAPDWTILPYSMCYPRNLDRMAPPAQLDEALETARKLASGFGFVRVDFYFMYECIKLGEMTFFPGNGAELFEPANGDLRLGEAIQSARTSGLVPESEVGV